jgi:hypothetical protein
MLFCAFYLDGYEPDLIKDDDTPPSARELTMLPLPDSSSSGSVLVRASKRQRPARHLAAHDDAFDLTAGGRDSKMSQGVGYAGAG